MDLREDSAIAQSNEHADVAILGGGPGGYVAALEAAWRGTRVASEHFKLKLLSHESETEGTKLIELDKTEIFTRLLFRPRIHVEAGSEPANVVEARVRRAMQSAQKYSLVANSVKSEIVIEPEISIVSG